jgi:hypothetical protein
MIFLRRGLQGGASPVCLNARPPSAKDPVWAPLTRPYHHAASPRGIVFLTPCRPRVLPSRALPPSYHRRPLPLPPPAAPFPALPNHFFNLPPPLGRRQPLPPQLRRRLHRRIRRPGARRRWIRLHRAPHRWFLTIPTLTAKPWPNRPPPPPQQAAPPPAVPPTTHDHRRFGSRPRTSL